MKKKGRMTRYMENKERKKKRKKERKKEMCTPRTINSTPSTCSLCGEEMASVIHQFQVHDASVHHTLPP
jgi:hypothetical protein